MSYNLESELSKSINFSRTPLSPILRSSLEVSEHLDKTSSHYTSNKPVIKKSLLRVLLGPYPDEPILSLIDQVIGMIGCSKESGDSDIKQIFGPNPYASSDSSTCEDLEDYIRKSIENQHFEKCLTPVNRVSNLQSSYREESSQNMSPFQVSSSKDLSSLNMNSINENLKEFSAASSPFPSVIRQYSNTSNAVSSKHLGKLSTQIDSNSCLHSASRSNQTHLANSSVNSTKLISNSSTNNSNDDINDITVISRNEIKSVCELPYTASSRSKSRTSQKSKRKSTSESRQGSHITKETNSSRGKYSIGEDKIESISNSDDRPKSLLSNKKTSISNSDGKPRSLYSDKKSSNITAGESYLIECKSLRSDSKSIIKSLTSKLKSLSAPNPMNCNENSTLPNSSRLTKSTSPKCIDSKDEWIANGLYNELDASIRSKTPIEGIPKTIIPLINSDKGTRKDTTLPASIKKNKLFNCKTSKEPTRNALFVAKRQHAGDDGQVASVIKQEWAITKINTFSDKSKTYEVMKPVNNHFRNVDVGDAKTSVMFAVTPNRTTVCYVSV